MAVDGSIKISTKIDQSGFVSGRKQLESGINSITKSLRGVAIALGLTFGVAAIINFSKESVKATTELGNAIKGLQSIVEGQGRSFNKAQKWIESYISDGLIPATQAITAYKNLALRGYDDSQIQQVLIALKDSAAFGRQASYTLGKAVESATEGLKNENSILVDNAGVTKNVAKMWEEYAKSIGTTANNLTKQQKIQAEVLGIMEETRFQVGDAAKLTSYFSGQLLRTQFLFNSWKVAIGNAIKPIAQAVIPSINAMISGFTRLANIAAHVIAVLFGKQAAQQKELATSGSNAAGAQKDLAKGVEAAGKAAKKSLASFDELNILQEDSAGIAGALEQAITSGSSGYGGGELLAGTTLSPTVQTAVDSLVNLLKPLQDIKLDPLKESLGRLWEQVTQFSGSTGAGLYWLTQYVLIPLSELHVEYTLPSLFDRIADSLEVINGEIALIQPIWEWFDKNVLERIRELDNTAFGESLKQFFGDFSAENFLRSTGAIGQVVLLLSDTKGWLDAIKGVLPLVRKGFKDSWEGIKKDWSPVTSWFDANVITPLSNRFNEYWDELTVSAIYTWDEIQKEWAQASGWFDGNVIKPISQGFKDFCNYLISAVEGFINGFINGINEVKTELNALHFEVPKEVPIIGGLSFGFNFPLASPISIPRLATGAVIPPNAEFLAVLGDQKRGTNIEAPLDTIVAAVMTALDKSDLGGGDMLINNILKLDGEVIYQNQQKVARRRGKNLIMGV